MAIGSAAARVGIVLVSVLATATMLYLSGVAVGMNVSHGGFMSGSWVGRHIGLIVLPLLAPLQVLVRVRARRVRRAAQGENAGDF
ncbi:hypothetical protein [Nguyenibacter vanlangensis]|uniref:Uncharacterized protein n=1 Tax=Nguyenibacter vanlangensis TaxID=1216886 RepID=A0A7Y7IV31_9PROT|nr:hypothetical protein [Nguyenibacter vanlangensis]NVN10832.1 hypothetical protein [Nguyenibacter vanlangensis]